MGVVRRRAKRNRPREKGRQKEDRYPDRQNKASIRKRKKENTEKKRLGAN